MPLKVSEITKLIETDDRYLIAARGSHRQYKHADKPCHHCFYSARPWARDEVLALAFGVVHAGRGEPLLESLAAQIADGGLDPHQAAEKLLSSTGYRTVT